jgi:hypothetical protein
MHALLKQLRCVRLSDKENEEEHAAWGEGEYVPEGGTERLGRTLRSMTTRTRSPFAPNGGGPRPAAGAPRRLVAVALVLATGTIAVCAARSGREPRTAAARGSDSGLAQEGPPGLDGGR